MPAKIERDFLEFRRTDSPRAMSRVFDAVAPDLILVAGHLARDAAGAEDLVQSTLLVAMEHRERFDSSRRLMPWLLGILVRLHRSERRRRPAAQIPEGWPLEGGDPADEAENAELAERLDDALESLPPNYREPLRLRLVHGLEPVQIAHALGRPLETVRTQLRRGKDQLRDVLPRSLACAFSWDLGLGQEGLALMKETVLATVPAGSSASLVPITAGGILVMKKALVVVVAVAIAWGGFFLLRDPGQLDPSLPAAPTQAAATEQAQTPALEATQAPEIERVVLAEKTTASTTTLACQVLWDEDDAPAVGVVVRLVNENDGEQDPEFVATSDEDGWTLFKDAAAGRSWLVADRGGSAELVLTAGESHETALRIPRGVLVRGIVIDQHDQPVPKADLWIARQPMVIYRGTWSGWTDANGCFELRSVEPGRTISAHLPGYYPAMAKRVAGAPGDEIEITLRLGTDCGRIRGIVRDPDGTACTNATILVGYATRLPLSRRGFDSLSPPFWLHTDSNGEFATDVPRKGAVPVWVLAPEMAVWHESVEVHEPETWLEINLLLGAGVAGHVRDPQGEPVANVRVRANQEGIDPAPGMAPSGPSLAQQNAWTDSQGSFQLANLQPGLTTIVAKGRKQDDAVSTLELIGGEVAACELVFGTAPTISGLVVGENGEPLEDIEISGTAEVGGNHRPPSVQTDTDGRFELTNCTRARYTLSASDPESCVNPHVMVHGVEPGGEAVQIVFPAAELATSRILGRLLSPDGGPLDANRLSLHRIDPDGTLQYGGTDSEMENGVFRTGLLPAGRYRLFVRTEATGRWMFGEYDLPSNEELDIGVIEAEAPGRIELSLEGVFEPEMHAVIASRGMHGGVGLPLRNGHGTSDALPPGTYFVGFTGARAPACGKQVEVRAGETTSVSLSLRSAVTRKVRTPSVPKELHVLTQTWRDGDGVLVGEWTWGVQRRESDSPHDYLLFPGTYHVVISALDGRQAETTFVVTADSESDDVIELPSPVMDDEVSDDTGH